MTVTRPLKTPRNVYRYNPACICDWCKNGGSNPRPSGYFAALGYDEAHVPPPRTPRLIALLSWYDEPPEWLTRCILSLERAGVTDLVALDGAYALYPDAQPTSAPEQYEAIESACRQAGIEHAIHIPDTVWEGNELEKRNRLFTLAEQVSQPVDWYMVIDADEFVTDAPDNMFAALVHSPFDVAGITLNEPGHPLGTIRFDTFPMLFRAIPGIRCSGNHYTYVTPDGRKLWGNAKTDRLEARHDLTGLVVEHHNQLRHTDRRRAALDYYETRDTLGIEELPADRSLLRDAA